MGDRTQIRELFNLGQAGNSCRPRFSNGVLELLEQDKTLSLRGMYYKGLHTIAGTKEKTFGDQDESDTVFRIWKCCWARRKSCMSSPKSVAPWWATSRFVMPVTKLTAGEWEPVAMPFLQFAGNVIEFVKCEPAFASRRKSHGVESIQRRSLLGKAQLHFDRRLRPTTSRRSSTSSATEYRTVCRSFVFWIVTGGTTFTT